MDTVFSEFNHEYIRPDGSSARHENVNGHDIMTVTGYGAISGKAYSMVYVDGVYDDYKTNVWKK